MTISKGDVEQFFHRYAMAFKDGLDGSLDLEARRSLYSTDGRSLHSPQDLKSHPSGLGDKPWDLTPRHRPEPVARPQQFSTRMSQRRDGDRLRLQILFEAFDAGFAAYARLPVVAEGALAPVRTAERGTSARSTMI